jgi:hypothetical protein
MTIPDYLNKNFPFSDDTTAVPMSYTVSHEDLEELLDNLPINNSDDPYTIKLEPFTFSNEFPPTDPTHIAWGNINNYLFDAQRYVKLDLSDCSANGDDTIKGNMGNNAMNIIKNNPYFTGITLPASLTIINNSAMSDCAYLTEIIILNSVTTLGLAFQNCTGLTSIVIPAGTTIGNNLFDGCSNLIAVTLPTGISTANFGSDAFPITGGVGKNNLRIAYFDTNGSSAGLYLRGDNGTDWWKN